MRNKQPWPFPKSKRTPFLYGNLSPTLAWPFPTKEKPVGNINEWPFPKADVKYPLHIVPAEDVINERDPSGKSLNSMGAKGDEGKDRTWLCITGFSNALAAVAKVTTFGANKYTPGGWIEVPDAENRYMDAFGRHMLKLGANEIVDQDSGCKHLAQMIWNLLAVLELEERAVNPNTGKPWPKEE